MPERKLFWDTDFNCILHAGGAMPMIARPNPVEGGSVIAVAINYDADFSMDKIHDAIPLQMKISFN